MPELEVVRWKGYGKDRLYVNGPTGDKVGWVDLATGVRTLTDQQLLQAFATAVDDWYAETCFALPIAAEPSTGVGPMFSSGPDWHDLATHVPGRAARAQAVRELAAMRERTRTGTFIARALDMKTEERSWRVGAAGEATVGARLERLTTKGWHVLHAVPVGRRGSDIDHLAIGHGGVYTLNTKNHPGGKIWVGSHAIRVNGQPTPYLRNSRHESQRAERLLSQAAGFPVPVRAALVFLTGTLIPNVKIKENPDDVLVLDRMDVPGAFKRAPRRLTPERVEAIFAVARRCTTWTGSASCSCSDSG